MEKPYAKVRARFGICGYFFGLSAAFGFWAINLFPVRIPSFLRKECYLCLFRELCDQRLIFAPQRQRFCDTHYSPADGGW